jgi:hypothetical protein
MGRTIFSPFLTFYVGMVSGVTLRVRFLGATWAGGFGVGAKENGVWGARGQDRVENGKKVSQRFRGNRLQAADLLFIHTLQTK